MNGGGKPPPYDKEKGIIYMYLHLGNDHVVKKTDIVGIFDITLPTHICSYVATSFCALVPYAFADRGEL